MTYKDKRIKELEIESRKGVLITFIVFVGMIIFVVLYLFEGDKTYELEEQLQSCQEKVPLWILEVECYYPNINYQGIETFGYNVIGNQNLLFKFESYRDYSSALDLAEFDKYCEIIK